MNPLHFLLASPPPHHQLGVAPDVAELSLHDVGVDGPVEVVGARLCQTQADTCQTQ